ncbi:hypothetical protein [Leyella stercorea]|uniref:hypothetical protein n=1 Tax=Leyella stercorea TaxID=363265 RepID=UPI003A8E6D19
MASLPYPRRPPNSFHRTTPSLFAQVLPQIAQNIQKLQAEDILPQIAQIFTEVGGYGIPAIPTPPSKFLPQNPL